MSRKEKNRPDATPNRGLPTEGRRRSSLAIGRAPGSLSFDPRWPEPVIRVLAYRPDEIVEQVVYVAEIAAFLRDWPQVWVNVDGLGSEEILRALAEIFSLHRLALEDVVNLGQRAKVEPYDEDLFIVARMPHDASGATEQVSILLGASYVLTFQETGGDCFDRVRERLRHGKGLIRSATPDYLVYALLDAVIDSYFPIVEELADALEALEEEVLESPTSKTVPKIHQLKRQIQHLRRAVWPHREAINTLLREPTSFFSNKTLVYVRDCYDHTIRVAEMIESQRELSSDLMSTYLSVVSNRMNEVMKVLAIIGTVFIPLGFIAGVYGMNFDREVSDWNMPELGWLLGYPFALSLMSLTALGMLFFFWRRGWFK